MIQMENTNGSEWKELEDYLENLIAERVAPGIAASAFDADNVLFRWHGGMRQIEPEKLPMEINTAFDMASVTKVIGTNMCAVRLAERGLPDWNTALSEFFEDPGNFGDVTITEMMSHQAGFVGHVIKPFFLENRKTSFR
jgi:CubicO group peptidase (beta-lactamase class C family)